MRGLTLLAVDTPFLEAKAALDLPTERIPQLDQVTERLKPLTRYEYVPAAGIVPVKEFYGCLADREFHSTQYVRHSSAPLHTPEPDLIHEVIGHGNLLAEPQFATRLSRAAVIGACASASPPASDSPPCRRWA